MNHKIFSRILTLLLCLCLLPISAQAALVEDDPTVTRSDFSLQVGLDADAFPDDEDANYRDWENYLKKIKLQGTVDTQRFLQPFSRVYFDGGLYLDDVLRVPFEYDGYYSFRYIKSPAITGASVHFQMLNFFEFMLKPYYYMDINTPYLALLMYPEASYTIADTYYQPISQVIGGEGERTISYKKLRALAEELNVFALEDLDYYQLSNYVITVFADMRSDELYPVDSVLSFLGSLDVWLDFLDPDRKGMHITVDGDTETYTIGETVVYEQTKSDAGLDFIVHIPTESGYEIDYVHHYVKKDVGTDLQMSFTWKNEVTEQLVAAITVNDLPKDGETEAIGTANVHFSGEFLENQSYASEFAFCYSRDQAQLPYSMSLGIDWIHPKTQMPALTLLYKATMNHEDESVLVDRPYDNQDDFFDLNESIITEYKERFTKSLVLAFVPFVVGMPSGVLSDVIGMLNQQEILSLIFGIY